MEISFYPLDFDYTVRDGKVLVFLYSKLEDGTKLCVIQQHQPFFYAHLKNIDEELFLQRLQQCTLALPDGPARVVRWEKVERELLGKKEPFLKLYATYPKAVPHLARELESWGAECLERDILFIHRYLRDVGIIPLTLVKATGEFKEDKELSVPAFYADTIQQESLEAVQKVKMLAVDIETYSVQREIDPSQNPILMVGFYGRDGQGNEFTKVITWKSFHHKLPYVEIVPDEQKLLQRFCSIVQRFQPDIITGYNTDGFDFPYLQERARKHKVTLNLGLDGSSLLASAKTFRDSEAKIKGILHLDMFKFIRNIFGKDLKTESYSLDAVSAELLGHKKQVVNLDKLSETWDHQPDMLAEFCAYNQHDAKLAFQLCEQLLPGMIEFTKLIGLPTFDLIRMRFSRLVENYILKRAIEYEVIAPNKPSDYELEQRREKSIEGAFVYEPTPGLYQDIVVFDFRSLYPTIITAHNIGPEGFRCSCCKEQEHVPGKEEYWFCQREKKFLPSVLEQLILRRVDLKRLIQEEKQRGNDVRILEARSYALKILANSFYGYLGFYGARWYCLEGAASTTAYARNYIKETIKKAEAKGFQVIYADTDSCFLLLGDRIPDEAMEFMNEINFALPGHMELEFQGHYPKGIFVAQKGTERGAKKKYALMNENGIIKVTGFEAVRRNWSPIAKEVQEKVLNLILQQKIDDALRYVRDIVKQLKEGKIKTQQLIIKTQITRDLERYATVGPHVTIAQKMKEKGYTILPGTVVEYVISRGEGLVRDRAKLVQEVKDGEYDVEYYIHNQLIPAVSSIFAVFGYTQEDLSEESSQKGLGEYL